MTFTPPQIAKAWGISTEKVMAWIRAGELRAIQTTDPEGRPAHRIEADDLEAFKSFLANQGAGPRKDARPLLFPIQRA